jgi:hypothetical protein
MLILKIIKDALLEKWQEKMIIKKVFNKMNKKKN